MPSNPPNSAAANYARLVWRSRRGMLELDVLLGNFVRHHYPRLSTQLQQQYQALLECEDPYLYAVLALGQPGEAAHSQIISAIRKGHAERSHPKGSNCG